MSKLIERDAAVEVLNQLVRERFSLSDGFQFYIDALKDVELNVMALPTVDAVPVRHGRWNCSDDVYETAVCSVCGWDTVEPWVHIKEWFEFCPHCGAKMDGKGDGNG